MAPARVTPLRGSPERDPERDPERGFACLCFFLACHPCSARAGSRAGKRAWPLWSLPAPARCIHSWPEWTPERDGVGPYPSLFAGAAPAKLRAYLWALKSNQRTVLLQDDGLVFFLRVKLLHGPNCPLR